MSAETRLAKTAMLFWLAAPVVAASYDGPESFDFTHVDLAIRYHEAPSRELRNAIAQSDAALHLKRHSDRTGYYPASASPGDISDDLLAELPTPAKLQAVSELVSYARRNDARQAHCMATASSYLPGNAQPRNSLHATWGYDIGVAMDDHASLNFVHPHFLANHQEIWFYCIHEVHHSGLLQIHPMAPIADIDTVRELYDFTRYSTFLEGLAVHSAYEARRSMDALDDDRDYRALSNAATRSRMLASYEQRLAYLRSEIDRPLQQKHWQVVEEMSSGDRLWYVAGAAMAAAIEEAEGHSYLLGVTANGPAAFFDAYDRMRAAGRSPESSGDRR